MPFVFTDLKRGEGVDHIVRFLETHGGLQHA
jgi:urease accessory protein